MIYVHKMRGGINLKSAMGGDRRTKSSSKSSCWEVLKVLVQPARMDVSKDEQGAANTKRERERRGEIVVYNKSAH